MKPLLISFFAVILCYSLFFDRRGKQIAEHEQNNADQTNVYNSYISSNSLDSADFYASKFDASY